MKNIILYLFFLLPIVVFAQAPTSTENYVKTKVYKTATTSSILAPTASQALQNISYLDGFGKPIQQVINQYSGTGKNIVIPIEYDAKGRVIKKYLPYSTQTTGLGYENNALSDVQNYTPYQGQNPYNETYYEDSSLSRVIKQASSGSDWAMGAGHEKSFDYATNDASGTFAVKLFIATATWNNTKGLYDTALTQTTNYVGITLYKTIIKNENWTSGLINTIENFTDKNGRLILKRMYSSSGAYDTYYVYDQFGNLTYMIPPKADMTITSTILDKLCYQYKYDNRNRLVEKKLPGKQWEFMVYDKLNRLVATGPALPPFSNLSASGWLITKYDVYNRPILTGWMSAGSSNFNSSYRKIKQDERNNETTNFSESRLAPGNTTPAGTANSVNPAYSYSNLSLPTSAYYILKINYYDDYNYVDAPIIPSNIENQPVYYNNTIKPKGLLTGKWIKAISLSTSPATKSELSYTLYDNKSRPIRVYIKNHESSTIGYTQIDSKFNFSGQRDYTITTHKRVAGDSPLTIKDSYTYSDQGRMLTHTSQINGGTIQSLSSNTYDELGRLISKNVGNTAANPLQKVDYTYNIKGWLTGVNDIASLTQTGDPLDLFAFKINYNTVHNDLNSPTISKQYNGNISETYWRTNSDNILRKYAYKYDDVNRLRYAYYRLPNSSIPSSKSYDEGITYDKNGNIITLHRNGDVDGGALPVEIDDLTYTYETDSNKLLKVTETIPTETSGFIDGTNIGDDYTYDANGNMLTDANKGITAIQYNHQNLPIKITFGTAGTIEYIYDTNGRKLEKAVTINGITATTKYLEGFQYFSPASGSPYVLQFFPTSEGYVAKVGSAYKYVFQYKDHLGNVRLSYVKNTTTGNIDIVEESHFYPFGLKHSGYNNSTNLANANTDAQKYKFQEQERQEELGLNWDSFKWRNYDYAVGRFMSVDPLTEKYNWMSDYQFSSNQVVFGREIEGMENDCDLNDQHDYMDGVETDFVYDWQHLDNVNVGGSINDFNRGDESYDYVNGRYEDVRGYGDNDDDYGDGEDEGYDYGIFNDFIRDIHKSYNQPDFGEMLQGIGGGFVVSGNTMFYVGAFLTMTGIGAELGVPLMMVGGEMSLVGIITQDAGKAIDNNLSAGELTKDVIVNVVMEGFETHMNDENLNTVLGLISTAL
jgi:RHS repeat-associated protein